MRKIFVRSPFIVEIAETGQTGSKIELFIWNQNTTEPSEPTYTLTKDIVSVSQIKNSYNISNYVKENIFLRYPQFLITSPEMADDTHIAFCKVKSYKIVDGVETYLGVETFVCFDGYTNYLDGVNYNDNSDVLLLRGDTRINIDNNNENKFINIWLKAGDYVWTSDGVDTEITNEYDSLWRFPIMIGENTLSYDLETTPQYIKIYADLICEPKYTPVVCNFINKSGGWENLIFFKSKTNSLDVKSQAYQFMPNDTEYNIYDGQSKVFAFNGNESVKLNTEWVNENYFDLIKDLLLSESVYLDSVPVIVKTKSMVYKTHLKDKNINYEVEFDYAFDLINNVI